MEEMGSPLLRDEDCVSANQPTPKSLPDFQRLFPDEQAGRAYLYSARSLMIPMLGDSCPEAPHGYSYIRSGKSRRRNGR